MSMPEKVKVLKCVFYPDHFWLEGEPEVAISASIHPPHSGFRSSNSYQMAFTSFHISLLYRRLDNELSRDCVKWTKITQRNWCTQPLKYTKPWLCSSLAASAPRGKTIFLFDAVFSLLTCIDYHYNHTIINRAWTAQTCQWRVRPQNMEIIVLLVSLHGRNFLILLAFKIHRTQ